MLKIQQCPTSSITEPRDFPANGNDVEPSFAEDISAYQKRHMVADTGILTRGSGRAASREVKRRVRIIFVDAGTQYEPVR